jgi:hypothetical protein
MMMMMMMMMMVSRTIVLIGSHLVYLNVEVILYPKYSSKYWRTTERKNSTEEGNFIECINN